MASMALTLKRQAASLAYTSWITNATGEPPNITPHENGIDIDWRPGQAKRMEKYFSDSMSAPVDPNDLNVSVNWTPVLVPLVIKKYGLYALGFSAALVIGTKLIWK